MPDRPAHPPPSAATRCALLGWLLVSAVHLYILSAGFTSWLPSYSAYYSRQADAFARGQSHLIHQPPAGLLALADPYDPDANRPYRRGVGVHDSVLYDGKFYLYWGPLPALLLVPVKAALSARGPVVVGDEWLVLGFTLATTLWVALILRHLWRRHLSDRSPAVVLVGTIIFGLSTPTTYFLARPAVYEAAIAGGQCFLLTGLLLTLRAFDNRPGRERMSPSPMLLMAAGACLAAAVACRVSLAVAVTAIAAMVAVRLLSTRAFARLAPFALPLVATALALLAFNHARFGRPLEFGQKYQLTGFNYRAVPALFSAANAVPSAWSYLARPVAVVDAFPFVRPRIGEGTFPDWVTLPPHYESHETIAGLLPTAPAFGLGLIPLVRLLTRRRTDPAGLRFAVAMIAVAGLVGFGPCLFMVGTTHRYLMDAWPCWAILTTVGLWQLLDPARRQVAVKAVVGTLVAWGVVVGILTGHVGYYDHFKTWNRPWFEMLGGGNAVAE